MLPKSATLQLGITSSEYHLMLRVLRFPLLVSESSLTMEYVREMIFMVFYSLQKYFYSLWCGGPPSAFHFFFENYATLEQIELITS